jgi:hypothetical protein
VLVWITPGKTKGVGHSSKSGRRWPIRILVRAEANYACGIRGAAD